MGGTNSKDEATNNQDITSLLNDIIENSKSSFGEQEQLRAINELDSILQFLKNANGKTDITISSYIITKDNTEQIEILAKEIITEYNSLVDNDVNNVVKETTRSRLYVLSMESSTVGKSAKLISSFLPSSTGGKTKNNMTKITVIYYTGIGSHKNGFHTPDEFLSIMKKKIMKNPIWFSEDMKEFTLKDWVKWSGSTMRIIKIS